MDCPSKRPRPENIRHFESCGDAEAAGFRACKRCAPDGKSLASQHATIVAEACRLLAQEHAPLQQLAERAGLSLFHFHRIFKRATGVTPRQYSAAHRAERLRQELGKATSVTEAIYDAGYTSSSQLYADPMLGMTPTKFRAGAPGEEIHFAVGACSLGLVLAAKTEAGVCAILIGDDAKTLEHDLRRRFPNAALQPGGVEIEKVVAMVDTPGSRLDLPLDIRGTAFQQRVWRALQAIPAGQTLSYTQVAEQLGSPKSVRAVASACAANAIAVAIPCHRVVRTDGSLSGYRWGIERKRTLLEREK